MRVGAYPAQ